MSNKIGTQIKLNEISHLQFIRDYDKEKEERMKRIFQTEKVFTVEEITKILKTIYKNVPFTFCISYPNNYFVISDQHNHFKYTHKIKLASGEKIEVTYDEKGLNFSSSELNEAETVSRFMKEEITRITRLKNMPQCTLDNLTENTNRLWKSYQAFYQENPDFSTEETRKKSEDMISILEHYHLLPTMNVFEKEQEFESLAPFGTITEESNLDEKIKKEINQLGRNMHEYGKEDKNPILIKTNKTV